MKLLVDTHALLWWAFDAPQLSARARGLLADPLNVIHVSSASAWEIATKYRLGRLPEVASLMQDVRGTFARAGLVELPITIAHAERAGMFPQPHRDPFDRMLAAQSIVEGFPIIGSDPLVAAFGAKQVW